jgi:S1-C subfamily serine protease
MATVAEDLGSPWIDEEGRLVGLLVGATGAATPQPDAPGTLRVEPTAAYAVPARVAAIVAPLLRADRYVARSRLGVASKALDEAVESHVCRDCRGGLVIVAVHPGGPAERAAVERYDILVGVGGTPIRRGMSLSDALLPHRPGSQVALDLVRRGEPVKVEVTLGARADD